MDLDFYGECCSHEKLCLVNDSLISVRTRAVESDFRKSNKSRMPKSFLSNLTGRSPCSCGHFKMRLTYVGPLVPELYAFKKISDAGP